MDRFIPAPPGGSGTSDSGAVLRNDQQVHTPDGPQAIGTLRPGGVVIGTAGHPVRVTAVCPQRNHRMYTVTTCDGVEVVTGARHQWLVKVYVPARTDVSVPPWRVGPLMVSNGRFQVHTTDDIVEFLGQGADIVLPTMTGPARYTSAAAELDPSDPGSEEQMGLAESSARTVVDPRQTIQRYRYGTVAQRLDLMRKVIPGGKCSGFVASRTHGAAKLVADVARSLAGTAHIRTARVNDGWIVAVQLPETDPETGEVALPPRRIISVAETCSAEATGLRVDSPDRLYVTEGYVLTHSDIGP